MGERETISRQPVPREKETKFKNLELRVFSTGSNSGVASRKWGFLWTQFAHLSCKGVRDCICCSVLMRRVSCHSGIRMGGDRYGLSGLNGAELAATLHESFLNPQ